MSFVLDVVVLDSFLLLRAFKSFARTRNHRRHTFEVALPIPKTVHNSLFFHAAAYFLNVDEQEGSFTTPSGDDEREITHVCFGF